MIESLLDIYTSTTTVGLLVEAGVILGIAILLKYFPTSGVSMVIDVFYEKVFEFYGSVIGEDESIRVKTYIVSLFFIILCSNLIGIVLEFIAPIIGTDEGGEFILEHYITIPSADLSFNISLAIVSMLLLLFLQFQHLGWKHFLHDYVPISGKHYLEYSPKKGSPWWSYVMMIVIKIFDICISIFLSLLEIVGILAKVISLSFRLFGNMISGTILLGMLVVGLGGITTSWFGFDFPIIFPVLIYLQEILVAFIQALVFPLLVSIFIRVAKASG